MASTKKTGAGYEKEGFQILEAMGYVVHQANRKAMWVPLKKNGKIVRGPKGKPKMKPITKGADIHGADLVALKPGEPTVFANTTTPEHVAEHKPLFPLSHFDLQFHSFQIWARQKGKKLFHVYKYFGGGDWEKTYSLQLLPNGEVIQLKPEKVGEIGGT